MPGLQIGWYEPPVDDDDMPGILDKKDGGSEDLMSRILLAVFILIAAYFLYTQVA